jgi:hypothetical protein
MRLMSGLNVGPPRFPLKRLSEEAVAAMEKDIQALGIDYAFETTKE